VIKNERIIGSHLIGQKFDDSSYFWSRPSFINYKPIPSGASNFGPTSAEFIKLVKNQKLNFLYYNLLPDNTIIPPEMIFASASGLDPDISPRAASLQINRIAEARHFNNLQKNKLQEIIEQCTENPQFYILGEPRVNVLQLNLELDKIK